MKKLIFLIAGFMIFAPSAVLAVGADQCGTGGWCACPGNASAGRCLGSYSSCEEACGLTSRSGSGPGSSGGGYTPQQQMILNGAQMMMPVLQQGIHDAIYGNPEEDARRQAEQAVRAAEQTRQAEIQERKKEEARDRLLGKSQGGDASSGLSLMGVEQSPSSGLTLMGVEHSPDLQLMTGDESISPPVGTNSPNNATTPVKHSEAFNKGLQDASQCNSQNAGSRCAGITGDQWQACLFDYRSGYQVGDKQRQQILDEATRVGRSAGASGKPTSADSDPRALGPCRTQWIEAYNRGYFQGEQAKNGH